MRYAIVIERSSKNYAAFVPDLPGCVAAAETLEETKTLIRSAVIAHVENLRAHGDEVPAPVTSIGYAEVA